MKKQTFRAGITTVTPKLFGFIILLFLAITSNIVQAQHVTDPDTAGKKETVQYLGMDGNMLLFRVVYNNPSGNKFNIAIRDENGYNLFRDSYEDKLFEKKFKLPKADNKTVTFVISGLKNDYSKSFAINTITHWEENVVVRKMD